MMFLGMVRKPNAEAEKVKDPIKRAEETQQTRKMAQQQNM